MNMTTATDAIAERTDLIPAAVPGFVVFLMALAAVLLWVGARFLTRRHRASLPWYGVVVPRVGTAIIAAWCSMQLLGRLCELSGPWPIWLAASITGLSIETAASRFRHERRVIPERLGLVLTLLRGLALLLLMVVLLQPVRVWSTDRHITRRVAVLLDDSESMHFTDRYWTTSEMLELGLQAELIDPKDRPLQRLGLVSGWSSSVRPWTRMLMAGSETPPALVKALEDGVEQSSMLERDATALLVRGETETKFDVLRRLQSLLRDLLIPAFKTAQEASVSGRLSSSELDRAAEAAEQVEALVGAVRAAVDDVAWKGLPASVRTAVKDYCTTTRFALGSAVLVQPPKGDPALLDRLSERYDVHLMRLGDGLEQLQADTLKAAAAAGGVIQKTGDSDVSKLSASDLSLRALTDYPTALEQIIKDIPSEELAGVLIVSDGRNNGASGLEPIGRRFGLQGVPVCGVVVGGSQQPRDVAIAEVVAPESIFLGDRVRMRVTVHVTGAKGSKIDLMMSGVAAPGEGVTNAPASDGEVILDKVPIEVLTDDYTKEVRLTHEPKEHGLRSYTIWTEALEDELFTTNNTWKVDVAISDDRTNVLLIDDRPRWEFRYLRNLFFGRDKSVHLQYYLVHPDEVAGVTSAAPHPPASASRKFGDAEAGSLPTSREEWRKFGMIVIGDVDADTLTPEVLADIRHCVSERGALLVVIAGRRHMPQSFDDETLAELLPIIYGPEQGDTLSVSRLRARLVLTGAGGAHPVMQQSGSYSENVAIWDDMPVVTWRFPVSDVKAGAEILAYAEQTEEEGVDLSDVDVAGAAAQIDGEMGKRARDALIVAQDYGRGKVLMLNFDQTWRLRHKVGDTLHHRFWGQVMRWGVGEKLRAGGEGLRLGTDKLIYTPRDVPRVLARVTETNFVGVSDAQLDVVVTHGGADVAHVTPVYREGSHGMYEVALPACSDPGRYELVMTRKDTGRDEQVETAFMVVTAKRSIELADVTSTRADLGLLARLTGGRVVGPDQARELWDAFGEGGAVVEERHERTLWDRPWVLFCLLGLLTTEWLLRKRGGLT